MNSEQFGGVLRAVLAFGGGWLVGRGWFDAATLDAVVGGIVTVGVAFWSYYVKKPEAPVETPPAA